MTFGETIAAKSLDLIEAAFRKYRIVATIDHVIDHLGFELADGADIAERRHGAAQPVGFLGGKFRGLDGDTHRLLLEQWHAEGLVQDLIQFILFTVRRRRRWVAHFFNTIPSPEIRMHHVALDRTRPDDGDLDDEIVEFSRPQTRQHVHLRAALDLEHAERLAPAKHIWRRSG